MALLFCGRKLLSSTRSSLKSFTRGGGYIVLVPEIGEDLPEKNPLVENDGLPQFNSITIENCMAAIASQTLNFEAGVKHIEQAVCDKENVNIFKDVLNPLEEISYPLDLTWGLSKTLYLGNSSLMPTKTYLSIHDRAKRARAAKFNNPVIYKAVKAALEKCPVNDEEDRVLKKFALEGKLNGLELPEFTQVQLKQYLNKLMSERSQFRHKVETSTQFFSHAVTDGSIVRDFPVELLRLTAADQAKPMEGPWTLGLDPNVYSLAMENCPDRDIRWNLWQANVSRGSGYGSRDLATAVHLEEIRYARKDIAKVLGYKTFADMSMETKMASSVDDVFDMLRSLLENAKPAQELEIQTLHEFACERGFRGTRIELWDVPYWRRKHLKSILNYEEIHFKEFFPLPKVIQGLFELSERLFNIQIKERSNVSAWHKDVKFYDIFEHGVSSPVGGFYLDLYTRQDEKIRIQQGNGWMVGIQNRSEIAESKPLAALVFNFDAPTEGSPSHLGFKEVDVLFHKFGLALLHLLSRTNYSEVSGSSNIEWDAVEISGHFMSHWLQDEKVLQSISGDKLPPEMCLAVLAMRKHLAGFDLCNEIYLSALDLELHNSSDYWLDIVKRLWPEFMAFPLDKMNSHPCSFTQIFSEEWAAAYYSHVWAKMVAADIFSAFREAGGDEQKMRETGTRFRDTFLALGGSSHPGQVFRKFRGRDPNPKALLKSLGLRKLNNTAMS